ncbi:MAG: PHP domain-containing protein [Acidobacteriota bacterium]
MPVLHGKGPLAARRASPGLNVAEASLTRRPASPRRAAQVGGVFLGAVLVIVAAIWAMLPPPALPPPASVFPAQWPVVRGAYHVHSIVSDGTGTPDDIAAAAAAAGLQFVILTDHGNGVRAPAPPAYRHGVLVIEGVEISTRDGHVVALDLPAVPFKLAGSAREVIADVHRFGGMAIAAHPGSPKEALAWRAWDTPFDGLEWLNADSEWRDEVLGSLSRSLLTYPFRPVETLTRLIDRPEAVLSRWDAQAADRRVVGIAGADAHARLGFQAGADPYEHRVLARMPAYVVSFRAFSNHVELGGPLTGDASADARRIVDAIRQGRLFTSLDGLATPGGFETWASSGPGLARMGEALVVRGPVVIEARISAPQGVVMALLKDGRTVYESAAPHLRVDVGEAPGVYRLEARLPSAADSPVPWVLANPFYVGVGHAAVADEPTIGPFQDRTGVPTEAWQAESSPGSTSELRSARLVDGTPAIEWRFALAPGTASSFAAIRFPLDTGARAFDRLRIRLEADRPSRVWVQLRAPNGAPGERWGQSVYVDQRLREVEVAFAGLPPLGFVTTTRPRLDRVDSLLLVVDEVHSVAGTSGALRITDLWLVR